MSGRSRALHVDGQDPFRGVEENLAVAVAAELAEDLYFCDKAREAGFRIHCDLDCLLGHITPAIVWPQQTPDGWSFGFGFPEGVVIQVPPHQWVPT